MGITRQTCNVMICFNTRVQCHCNDERGDLVQVGLANKEVHLVMEAESHHVSMGEWKGQGKKKQGRWKTG
jgi:hypothetical protein